MATISQEPSLSSTAQPHPSSSSNDPPSDSQPTSTNPPDQMEFYPSMRAPWPPREPPPPVGMYAPTQAYEPLLPVVVSTTQPPQSIEFAHLEAAKTLSGLAATFTSEPSSSSSPSIAPGGRPILSSLVTAISSTPSLATAGPSSSSQSQSPTAESPSSAYRYEAFSQIPRLPPILQVEKTKVTTSATQAASAQRRRNDATFKCPVPGCGSTFTRRFNLRGEFFWSISLWHAAVWLNVILLPFSTGHLRSHTEEKPYICSWPDCAKGFARQHDCKRHQALHTSKSAHLCSACDKSFSRMDALNRHRTSLHFRSPCVH